MSSRGPPRALCCAWASGCAKRPGCIGHRASRRRSGGNPADAAQSGERCGGLAGVRERGRVPGTDQLLFARCWAGGATELLASLQLRGWSPPTIPAMAMTASTGRGCARHWPRRHGWTSPPSPPAPRIWPMPTRRWTGLRRGNGGSGDTAGLGPDLSPPRAARDCPARAGTDRAPTGRQTSRGQALARLFDSLVAHQPASIGNLVARPLPDGWSFMKAPRRRGSA